MVGEFFDLIQARRQVADPTLLQLAETLGILGVLILLLHLISQALRPFLRRPLVADGVVQVALNGRNVTLQAPLVIGQCRHLPRHLAQAHVRVRKLLLGVLALALGLMKRWGETANEGNDVNAVMTLFDWLVSRLIIQKVNQLMNYVECLCFCCCGNQLYLITKMILFLMGWGWGPPLHKHLATPLLRIS